MRVEARALSTCLAFLLFCQAASKAVESSAQVEVRHVVQMLGFVRAVAKAEGTAILQKQADCTFLSMTCRA